MKFYATGTGYVSGNINVEQIKNYLNVLINLYFFIDFIVTHPF